MEGKLRVAIIGCGEMGLIRGLIVKNIELFELTCVVDSNMIKARLLGNQLDVKAYTKIGKAVKNEKIDTALICTPVFAHYGNAFELLESRINVYCEKPLSDNKFRSFEMYEYARKQGVLHGVGYNYRLYPTFRRMKEYLDSNILGNILYIKTVANSSGVLDFGDKRTQDERSSKFGHYGAMGVHAIDLMLWYGGRLENVSAISTKRFSTLVDDYITAICRFRNGIHGVIDMSWSHHGYIDKPELAITITGENGTATVNPDYIDLCIKNEINGMKAGEHKIYNTELPSSCSFSFTTRALGNDIEEFGKALSGKCAFKPDWFDGYLVDEVVQTIKDSSTRREWITLPIN